MEIDIINPGSSSVVDIPFDIIADQILPRLPAKSLIRFTSVCKKWQGFIKSRHFIQAHLHHNRFEARGKLEYPLIYHQQSFYVFDQNYKPIFFSKLDCPSSIVESSSALRAEFIQSCHGLILVKLVGNKQEVVLLWNPCIKRMKLIHSVAKKNSRQVFGLGFDESSKQHKVVKIRYLYHWNEDFNRITTVDVEVYSSSVDSWRKVDSKLGKTIPSSWGFKDYGRVYLNGCIHWMIKTGDVYSIIMFDFENESFKEMALPVPKKVKVYDAFDALIEYEGSLALMYVGRDNDEIGTPFSWNMIYMTEYGIFESWTKKFSVILSKGFNFCYPYSFTKNGWLVYEEVVYDEEEKFCGTRLNFVDVQDHRSKFMIQGFENPEIVINYMESLTLLC